MTLQLSQVSFFYRNRPVLQNIDLLIQAGEYAALFGPNGGGKTTLLKLIAGFLTPQAGEVLINGLSPEEARHRIGYVPQIHRADPDFPITVSELIALGTLSKQAYFGGFSREALQAADHWMERLNLLACRKKMYGELSGGLAQRALLARALISNPDILLLDEPTANIDPGSTELVLDTLEAFKGKKTILFVTHDLKTVGRRVEKLFCVEGTITSYEPGVVCNHFALGLYHPPHLTEARR